jgi:hypothetical protein
MAKKIVGLKLALSALNISLFGQTNQDKAEVRRKIVGTWKLVLEENTLEDGRKTHDFGPNGKGFLMYSADGHMCAVEMNPDRPMEDCCKAYPTGESFSFRWFVRLLRPLRDRYETQ